LRLVKITIKGQMVPNYGLYQNPNFQSEIMSKSMSRMDSYDPGDLSESAMSSASSHFTKIFQPPKSKPPPPPMPFAERTIYVHVKNEKELEVKIVQIISSKKYFSARENRKSFYFRTTSSNFKRCKNGNFKCFKDGFDGIRV
jgi:hypothetical protein